MIPEINSRMRNIVYFAYILLQPSYATEFLLISMMFSCPTGEIKDEYLVFIFHYGI